ncbi:hypothetical protein MNEG_8643, partial [Monoraphidium neglectum]
MCQTELKRLAEAETEQLDCAGAVCRLSNLGPLGSSNLEASYNPQRVKPTAADGGVALELVGIDGTRVHTADGDSLYGMFQWSALPSSALRSDYHQETTDFSEI